MIAGPNGSGKTTLTQDLRTNYNLDFGYYVNADELERTLRQTQQIDFCDLALTIADAEFQAFYQQHPLWQKSTLPVDVRAGILYLGAPLPEITYFPTLLADFLRERLVQQKVTFSFETVMSDPGKIAFLRNAREVGYRNYLYYICTQDPLTNIDRVKDRVSKNGHAVPEDKIVERYKRSLNNLYEALGYCHRAYLFDNSGEEYKLIAELHEAQLELKSDEVPRWLEESVLSKQ